MSDENPFDVVDEELVCWRDSSRLCSSSCVAYQEKCEEDPRFLPCILLNIQRGQAKSFANIATELKRYNDHRDSAYEEMEASIRYLSDKTKKPGAFSSKEEAEKYAQQIKEMDPGPPEIK